MHFLNLKPCREKKVKSTLLLDDQEVIYFATCVQTRAYTWFETVVRNNRERGVVNNVCSQLLSQQPSALSEAQANTIPLYTPRLVNLPFIQYALCKLQSLAKDHAIAIIRWY